MTGMSRYSDLTGNNLIAESNYTFDASGRLTNLTHNSDGEVLSAYEWAYDQANRITKATSPDEVSEFNYDKSDQLTGADHSEQDDEIYSYDDNGNRVNTGYVTGENNQLTSDGKYNYEYDGEGNRVKRTEIATGEVTNYEWDYRNRLVGVETKNSSGQAIALSEYTYDVFDNRIAKSVDSDGDGAAPATEEHFVYDGEHIALTFDGEGNQTERFLHGVGVDQVIAQENAGGEVLWALTDNQGSVRMLLDNQGNVVNEITYDAFGNITLETNPEVNFRFSYVGKELDPETGLRHNGARYVDGNRFISEDPISFAGGDANLYRYVGNNPVNFIDPTGKDWLNNVDRFAAGFGDAVTFGGTTWLREKLYGEQATRNHQGAAFTGGQITGAAASLLTGFNTPGNFAKGLTWAQKAAIGYDVAATGYGAYNATTKLQQGCATPLDALNFLPAVGYGASRLNDAARGLDDVGRGVDDVGDDLFKSFSRIQMML